MKFDNKKLTALIDQKSKDKKIKKHRIRTFMRMSMGISMQLLSAYEKGVCNPDYDKLIWLRDFFGFDKIEKLFIKESKKNDTI